MRLLPILLASSTAVAQHVIAVPSFGQPSPSEPTSPAARTVHDTRARLTFHLPAGWNFSRQDGELSTFALDARSASPSARLQEVANLNFNPFPLSTFSGAIFYVSETPRSTAAACARETATAPPRRQEATTVDGVPFQHGHGELIQECVVARDEVYTTLRRGSCLRFDLVINTFCGASSGARDMTRSELDAVNQRLTGILDSVHFDTSQAPASIGAH